MVTVDKSTKSPVRTELLLYSVLKGQDTALLCCYIQNQHLTNTNGSTVVLDYCLENMLISLFPLLPDCWFIFGLVTCC